MHTSLLFIPRSRVAGLHFYRALLLLILLLLSGSGVKGGDTGRVEPGIVTLMTDRLSYGKGDTVMVRLTNGIDRYVVIEGYCGARIRLERMVDGAVEQPGMLTLEVDTCMGHLISIEPGTTMLLYARTDLTHYPGRYRLAVETMLSDTAAHFNAGMRDAVRPMLEGGGVVYSRWFVVE